MSAFLGPIHFWLYNKIRLQQAIVDEIYALGIKNGLPLEMECNHHFGEFENKPLEEMIDLDNIHGWLQEKVSQVEYKYAYAITKLLAKNPDAIEQLKALLTANGATLAKGYQASELKATEVYKIISDTLLDGMPCDHANQLLKQEENEVIWRRSICVHSSYWEVVDGDINIYYELRDAWLNGFVKELGFEFDKPDSGTFVIRKDI